MHAGASPSDCFHVQKAKQKHNRPLNSGWALSPPQSCCIISLLPPSSLSSQAWTLTPSLVLSTSALSKSWEVPRPLSPRVRVLTSALALPMSHLGSLGKSRNSSLLVQWLLGQCKTQASGPQLAPPLQGFISERTSSTLRSSSGRSLANAPWPDVP